MLWEHIRLSSLDYFLDLLFSYWLYCLFASSCWPAFCHAIINEYWLIGIGSKRLHGPSWFFAHRLLSTDPTLCSKDIRVTQKWRYFHRKLFPNPLLRKNSPRPVDCLFWRTTMTSLSHKRKQRATTNAEGGHSEHLLWHCLPDIPVATHHNRFFSKPCADPRGGAPGARPPFSLEGIFLTLIIFAQPRKTVETT